jgi:hypothetical protein
MRDGAAIPHRRFDEPQAAFATSGIVHPARNG